MLGNRNLIPVLVEGANEEENGSKQQREKAANVGQHLVDFVMSPSYLIDSSSLLDFDADEVARVQIYRVCVVAGQVVPFLN